MDMRGFPPEIDLGSPGVRLRRKPSPHWKLQDVLASLLLRTVFRGTKKHLLYRNRFYRQKDICFASFPDTVSGKVSQRNQTRRTEQPKGLLVGAC